MNARYAITTVCCAAAFLSQACQTAPEMVSTGAISDGPAAMPQDPRQKLNDMKEQRFQAAVTGLDFETGLVVVTEPAPDAGHEAAMAHLEAGWEKLNTNRRTGAVAEMTLAVRADPQWAEGCNALGRALDAKGKALHALAAYRTAVSLDGGFVEARYNLAVTLAALARFDEAIEQMSLVVELDPRLGAAHERLAIWTYYTGDTAAAWRHVKAAEALGHQVPPQFLALLEARTTGP